MRKDLKMMRSPKYERVFQKFIDGVIATIDVKYEDPKSVRKNNRGVDQYRAAAKTIADTFPDRIIEFAELLDHPEKEIRYVCALCLIEIMLVSNEDIKEKAISVIRDRYLGLQYQCDRSRIEWWASKHNVNLFDFEDHATN